MFACDLNSTSLHRKTVFCVGSLVVFCSVGELEDYGSGGLLETRSGQLSRDGLYPVHVLYDIVFLVSPVMGVGGCFSGLLGNDRGALGSIVAL